MNRTMPADASSILADLEIVDAQRARRHAAPELSARVQAIKHYQQRRFSHTYSDLLASPRYAGAARFFLDELYGPQDFSQRDAQFARVVPAMVRLFPQEIVDTVGTLARLHALSETLDSGMGARLERVEVDAPAYIAAWQATAGVAEREHQIALTLEVGASLDRLTRRPLVRHSLHLMRRPARAAGLGELQRFLECGFDTFKAMRGAQEFLALIGKRERELAAALFEAKLQGEAGTDPSLTQALDRLP
jgi:hypothetical protein